MSDSTEIQALQTTDQATEALRVALDRLNSAIAGVKSDDASEIVGGRMFDYTVFPMVAGTIIGIDVRLCDAIDGKGGPLWTPFIGVKTPVGPFSINTIRGGMHAVREALFTGMRLNEKGRLCELPRESEAMPQLKPGIIGRTVLVKFDKIETPKNGNPFPTFTCILSGERPSEVWTDLVNGFAEAWRAAEKVRAFPRTDPIPF